MSGCLKRSEIEASIWLNNAPLPDSVCVIPENTHYGFYRRLNDGRFEFVSFCDARAHDWLAIHKDEFQRLLEKAYPKNKN